MERGRRVLGRESVQLRIAVSRSALGDFKKVLRDLGYSEADVLRILRVLLDVVLVEAEGVFRSNRAQLESAVRSLVRTKFHLKKKSEKRS